MCERAGAERKKERRKGPDRAGLCWGCARGPQLTERAANRPISRHPQFPAIPSATSGMGCYERPEPSHYAGQAAPAHLRRRSSVQHDLALLRVICCPPAHSSVASATLSQLGPNETRAAGRCHRKDAAQRQPQRCRRGRHGVRRPVRPPPRLLASLARILKNRMRS